MMSTSPAPSSYILFCASSILVLKYVNEEVTEPYMDEPFHVPQAQAYCNGDYWAWDPKITTPPGLYVLSLVLKRVFMLKCNLAMLRLTPLLALLVLPLVLTRLLCYHKRERPPPSLFTPTLEAVVLAAFPIAWFFGFLYYTEVPSLVFVFGTIVSATQGNHWIAALLGVISCTFRQNNIIWVLYAYASSQLMALRFRRNPPGSKSAAQLHDPPALTASAGDLLQSALSLPRVLPDLLPPFAPYALVLAAFGAFVKWNGGIVLGDKSNHVPAFHVPQLYYFISFATILGWPALISADGGIQGLARDVWARMFGSKRNAALTSLAAILMGVTIHKYTIHHPFLLSDNRHYTFYVWRRIFLLHPAVPYLLIPGYIACAWAWFLRIGQDQTLLQNLLLPVFVLPTLLPTPLLEPRYFLIPYVLLRAQIKDAPGWGVAVEGLWYAAINATTMWVFLYKERVGVGRFMW
ncbi:glycosyltransferase family 59 protein [Gelatoporia subvermispora B]|uniref:Dol-P-Glc:Glc(2)Man(9)GlcNAc(2)-PP-Dol alpha-1,2-glucosyltransferase n=1 Tax=Ceriporiopsis subvermispora (strain B) TaxID=914234 RepID=M2PXH0_CERS8|nr:glycosyltransferase family 59 protein [Gelatoporia subvermispora B]